MAKKLYITPVLLTSVLNSSDSIDMTGSQEGATGTGVTSKDFAELANSLGLSIKQLEDLMNTHLADLDGFDVYDPDTYYILQEYLLDNDYV